MLNAIQDNEIKRAIQKTDQSPNSWTRALYLSGKWLSLILSNIPLALISLPASYGAAQFSQRYYPEPWNWVLGGAFESTYLGAWIFAQKKNRPIFIATILVASLCGAIFNTLHVAQVEGLVRRGGNFGDWILAVIHGAPMSLLGLAYAGLLHFSADESKTNLKDKIKTAVEAATKQFQDELSKLSSSLGQWKEYAASLANSVQTLQGQYESVLAENTATKDKMADLLVQLDNSTKIISDMEASQVQELEQLISRYEAQIDELKSRLEKPSGHAQLTVLRPSAKKDNEPEDKAIEVKLDNSTKEDKPIIDTASILSRFKTEPTIENLLPAFEAGVSEGTISKWIQRSKASFTLGQAKSVYLQRAGAGV
jgi:hypothetical protein